MLNELGTMHNYSENVNKEKNFKRIKTEIVELKNKLTKNSKERFKSRGSKVDQGKEKISNLETAHLKLSNQRSNKKKIKRKRKKV